MFLNLQTSNNGLLSWNIVLIKRFCQEFVGARFHHPQHDPQHERHYSHHYHNHPQHERHYHYHNIAIKYLITN